jgi:hypothetical protein
MPGFRLGIYVFKDAEIIDFAAYACCCSSTSSASGSERPSLISPLWTADPALVAFVTADW